MEGSNFLNPDTRIDDADSLTAAPPQTETGKREQPPKTRGRKPGQKNGTGKAAGGANNSQQTGKKEKLSARQLTGILFLGHSAAADMTGQPLLKIDEAEAEKMAGAIVDVLQYYDFEASAKTVAWANLVGTFATIYGLRIWSMTQAPKFYPPAGYSDNAPGD